MKSFKSFSEVYKDSGLGKWFGKGGKGGVGKGGWDRYNTKGERIGKCGDAKASEGKPNKHDKSASRFIDERVERARYKTTPKIHNGMVITPNISSSTLPRGSVIIS